MNKNILAIAIAAAVAAPSASFAAATVYGNMHGSVSAASGVSNEAAVARTDPGVTTVAGSNGVDTQSITNVQSNSSFLGVKGSEDLGSGLKAVYQFETGFGLDGEGTNTLGSNLRNTFVGLGGGFGTVLLGRHDSPIKMVGRKFDLFGDQTGNNRNIMGAGNTNLVDGRHSNVLAYSTPTMSGFSALIAYVPGAGRDNEYGSDAQINLNAPAGTSTTGQVNNVDMEKRDAWSANLNYKLGNFDAALGYINVSNSFTDQQAAAAQTVTANKQAANAGTFAKSYQAYRLGAGYTFGNAKVVGLFQNSNYSDGAKVRDRNAFGIGGSYKVTAAGTVKAQYYIADNTKGAKDGANMITVGYDHAMSKNTTVYAVYAAADNNRDGAFTTNMANAGTSDNTTAVAGKDNSAFSVGVQHKF